MKQLIFILTIYCLFNTAKGQTNIYRPFPDSIALWKEISISFPAPPTYISNQYSIDGTDTVIFGKTYLKIFDNSSSIIGAYRQDTSNKLVLAILFSQPYPKEEFLLYDFSLEIGDTFTSRPLTQCDSISIVESIDSIFVAGNYRRKINLVSKNNRNPISIIEGIGSLDGLFKESCFEFENKLCSFHDGNEFFSNSNFRCDVGISEIETNTSLKITPNPFSEHATIALINNKPNSEILIYNLHGTIVRRIEFISGQNLSISRDQLHSGIYYLILKNDNNIITTRKFIISDN